MELRENSLLAEKVQGFINIGLEINWIWLWKRVLSPLWFNYSTTAGGQGVVNRKIASRSGQRNGWKTIKSLDYEKKIGKLFLGESNALKRWGKTPVIINDWEGK